MKQFTVISSLIFAVVVFAGAQTEKGTILLGGELTFSSSDGSNSFTGSPNVGLLILDDVAIGARLSIQATNGSSAWAIGPFARIYFAGSHKGKFFGQVGVNVGGARESDVDFGFSIGAGYAIFLNHSVAIELGTNYSKAGKDSGIFTIGAGFQIHYK